MKKTEEELILKLYKELVQLKTKAAEYGFIIENINLKSNYINPSYIINSVILGGIKININ